MPRNSATHRSACEPADHSEVVPGVQVAAHGALPARSSGEAPSTQPADRAVPTKQLIADRDSPQAPQRDVGCGLDADNLPVPSEARPPSDVDDADAVHTTGGEPPAGTAPCSPSASPRSRVRSADGASDAASAGAVHTVQDGSAGEGAPALGLAAAAAVSAHGSLPASPESTPSRASADRAPSPEGRGPCQQPGGVCDGVVRAAHLQCDSPSGDALGSSCASTPLRGRALDASGDVLDGSGHHSTPRPPCGATCGYALPLHGDQELRTGGTEAHGLAECDCAQRRAGCGESPSDNVASAGGAHTRARRACASLAERSSPCESAGGLSADDNIAIRASIALHARLSGGRYAGPREGAEGAGTCDAGGGSAFGMTGDAAAPLQPAREAVTGGALPCGASAAQADARGARSLAHRGAGGEILTETEAKEQDPVPSVPCGTWETQSCGMRVRRGRRGRR